MSTIVLEPSMTGPVVRGNVPISLPLPWVGSDLSLFINAPGVNYRLEAPLVDDPVVEVNKILARFLVDENVYLELNLIGQGIELENKFEVGKFSLFYHIEERRPRAHFVADTLMAVIGLAGKLDLRISEPEVNTCLNIDLDLLEISKMLHRRQTAYRLMIIEQATNKQFLLPPTISEKEVETVSFIYHAIIDKDFIWTSGSFNSSISATEEYASLFAQSVQPFRWQNEVVISETLCGQTVDLGRATVTIEDAIVKNLNGIRGQLEAKDGRQVNVEISSLSGQARYEFKDIPYSPAPFLEKKIQTLIELEPYLDAAIAERYHALAAATLAGLTEDEKEEVTARPEIGEAFLIDNSDGE